MHLTPFWPTPQLWTKLFLASLCAVSLNAGFSLVALSLSGGISLMGGHRLTPIEYLLGGAGVALTIGMPLIFGALLAHSLKGIWSGLMSLLTVGLGGFLVGEAYGTWIISDAMLTLPLAFITGAQIVILELTSGDIRGRAGSAGLGVGLVIGTLLTTALAGMIDPQGQQLFEIFSIPWLAYSCLVWFSVVLFAELFTRRVGAGGAFLWIGLIGTVFGLSFLLMR